MVVVPKGAVVVVVVMVCVCVCVCVCFHTHVNGGKVIDEIGGLA